jgi:hypothetical protein
VARAHRTAANADVEKFGAGQDGPCGNMAVSTCYTWTVATDNFPQTYIYISRRIVRDLYRQHSAHARSVDLEVDVTAPVIGVKARGGQRKGENDYWLAQKVTQYIRDNTGTLLDPGVYVRARMDVTWAEVPFLEGGYEVARLSCYADTEAGRAFVALCGSLRNYEGYFPGGDEYRGWYPSRSTGMQRLLASFSGGAEDVASASEWRGGEFPEDVTDTARVISTPGS